ncbi:MAG: hypothetical protein ISS45_04865 [Candidatus Omnitrophica bacterium]|nr:hypothetical protein [Candidatus Omnitrophota bacterium]
MKPLLPTVLILFLLSGCSFGKLSAVEGSAKFSIPFGFHYPKEQDVREKMIIEEMDRLEAEMILEKEAQKFK